MGAALVTIAIPTLNRASLLRLTLSSALGQMYPNLEVLVSDNGSEDETQIVLHEITDSRLRILRQTSRLAMYDHWNVLIQEARGEYFLLLSDDDILEPNALDCLVQRLESDPSLGFAFCRGTMIDGAGKYLIPGKCAPPALRAEEILLAFFRSEVDMWPCSILFRTEDVRAGYPAGFPLGADAALWMRVACQYEKVGFVSSFLTRYRVHQNTTNTSGFGAWQAENLRLSTHAVRQLESAGRGSAGLFERIGVEARRLNMRIAAGLILNSGGNSRLRKLLLLSREGRQFLSLYGAFVIVKGLIRLCTPSSWRRRMVLSKRLIKQQLYSDR